ncbi:hypothetical protein ONE63_003472 [Megalurothrips usitatus]|uniref:Uncharacterized protein n=1 Tax=Megalurothrips usitatus TaxID=439358 RepID=A0AAV7XAW8_9NEOP|nr:hypothetical protein ONE63_003472 [Megalurothrips usitatus]
MLTGVGGGEADAVLTQSDPTPETAYFSLKKNNDKPVETLVRFQRCEAELPAKLQLQEQQELIMSEGEPEPEPAAAGAAPNVPSPERGRKKRRHDEPPRSEQGDPELAAVEDAPLLPTPEKGKKKKRKRERSTDEPPRSEQDDPELAAVETIPLLATPEKGKNKSKKKKRKRERSTDEPPRSEDEPTPAAVETIPLVPPQRESKKRKRVDSTNEPKRRRAVSEPGPSTPRKPPTPKNMPLTALGFVTPKGRAQPSEARCPYCYFISFQRSIVTDHVKRVHKEEVSQEIDGLISAQQMMENLCRRGSRIVSEATRIAPHIRELEEEANLTPRQSRLARRAIHRCLAESLVFVGDEYSGERRVVSVSATFKKLLQDGRRPPAREKESDSDVEVDL